jgi:peptide/nickel transport system substrate-binding protein
MRYPVSRRRVRALALASAGTLLLGACTGDEKPRPTPPTPRRGGSAVFGAEQWPECINPITSCSAATWTHYTVLQHVLPRAMQLDSGGNVVASPLLVEAPTLDNGGLSQSPFTVRFKLNTRAVWDDGSPITSNDFAFTWRAIRNTTGAYDVEPYEAIDAIDTKDPRTAVVRFAEPLGDWWTLFGGPSEYVLKKAAFPNVDPGKPDLRTEMETGIPFSGGPFRLERWDKRSEVVLVRNDRYFGGEAKLDRVTFVPTVDQEREIKALRRGDVAAIFPQPSEPGLLDLFRYPRLRASATDGLYFEALWLNLATHPMNDAAVREAFMYSIDRQAIVDKLIKPNNPRVVVLGCGLVSLPSMGPWCRTRPFDRFTYDPARARRILERDGFDCSATFCAKGGKRLEVEYLTFAWSSRRLDTRELVTAQAKRAGFAVKPRDLQSTLAGERVPPTYPVAMAEFPISTDGDPSVTEFLACDQIPSGTNKYSGSNFNHWCNPQADRLLREADRELDPHRRLALMESVYQLEAQDFVALPLYVIPVISAWRTDKIAGPIGRYSSTPYGMFFNMNEWHVP